MPTFIFKKNHISFDSKPNDQSTNPSPLHKQELAAHIGVCLQRIPPKQLCRCLREGFFLHWEELQKTSPNFTELVTEMLVLLARLDAEEDRIARNS
jgi:hypothetical protein